MTLKEAYNYGVYFLTANGIDEPEFKALCLCCHSAGIKNSQYNLHLDDEIIMKPYADKLFRVKNLEPLQYVIGKWDFYESEFFVGDGVLIPRPETEELVDLINKDMKDAKDYVVYDLCSGSGCIGISIAKKNPTATVYCIEKSEEAFQYLQKNAQGINNVITIKCDINSVPDIPLADIIVSNPPYIKSDEMLYLQDEVKKEPSMALDGGKDGLDFYRIINNKYSERVKNNGKLYLEIGENQGESIGPILSNFKNIKVIKDMYGNSRMVKAIRLD